MQHLLGTGSESKLAGKKRSYTLENLKFIITTSIKSHEKIRIVKACGIITLEWVGTENN